jgi:hypothetical protein
VNLSIATTGTIMAKELKEDETYGLKGFIKFLSENFKIKWLKDGEIKIRQNTTEEIELQKDRKKLKIVIIPNESKAILFNNGLNVGELSVEKISGDYKVPEYLFTELKPLDIKDYWNIKTLSIHKRLKKSRYNMAADLLENCYQDFIMTKKELDIKNSSFDLLSSDQNFRKLVDELKLVSDKHYLNFIKRNKPETRSE